MRMYDDGVTVGICRHCGRQIFTAPELPSGFIRGQTVVSGGAAGQRPSPTRGAGTIRSRGVRRLRP